MRRALGLLGDGTRPRGDGERIERAEMPPPRTTDRFGNGGLHRRRFVQDGDVPVTVLRRDNGHDTPSHRAAPAAPGPAPTSSRLQRVEAALAAETAARTLADRALAEAQASVRDLQTKIGHAELAKNEAVEALRREREAIAGQQNALASVKAALAEALQRAEDAERHAAEFEDLVAEERQLRRDAEKALKTAEAARQAAERLVEKQSEGADTIVARPGRRTTATSATTSRKRGRPPSPRQPELPEFEPEPEPVKWWLTPAKPAPRRRG
ncbi:hypothetical protein [Rhodopila sp.]|uniref:hypothetical protein n=1 Tax=Rhodopila sp. TaxID=2480087 RepID=UPI002D7F81F9|nr:hypothetical protein [Rhodopila sp.]